MKRSLLLVGVATVTALSPSGSGTASAVSPGSPARTEFSLVSAANPSPGRPRLQDQSMRSERTAARQVRSNVVAQSSATCDGCAALASTLQVLTLTRASTADVNNVATAWSQCADCDATALAVQVVLAPRLTGLSAANRALALNAACTSCQSAAAAYQFVVVASSHDELTKQARGVVDQARAQMRAQLDAAGRAPDPRDRSTNPKTGGSLKNQLDQSAARLQQSLRSELGASSVEVHADVQTGGPGTAPGSVDS